MRVLWFTNSSVDYQEHINGYNGGGWMTSLKKVIDKEKDIELGISFLLDDSVFKKRINNTTYYPVSVRTSFISKIYTKIRYVRKKKFEFYDNQYVDKYIEVINDFKPSIIHIWGTEKNFGLICNHTKIPVVIHLQGIINPYLNAFFPPKISLNDYILKDGILPQKISRNNNDYKAWEYIAERENEIFNNCHYFMGRTQWDKIITAILAPNAKYFHCNEALRDEFYLKKKWHYQCSKKLRIITTISSPLYKGGDLLLKTANLLKNKLNLDFEWNVYGISNLKFQEKIVGIKTIDVNLKLNGIATSEQIHQALLTSNVFIHPSYIDNSPNSICEAQMCGVPIIACDVGGISSLIKDNATGILIPSNDPFSMAYKIKELCASELTSTRISIEAIRIATERHALDSILTNLLSIYNTIDENQPL